MSKRMNCKHGLDNRQEIQARRLRIRLVIGDKEVIEQYKKFWKEWFKEPKTGFIEFLQKKDIVYYSAYVRAIQSNGVEEIDSMISN